MTEFNKTAVLGAGVIGASWTALFLAAGKDVCVFDVSDTAEADVKAYVDAAWPTLVEIGLAVEGRKGALTFAATPEEAVKDADFIQENVPERLPIKLDLFQRIEPLLKPSAVLASSASGLMVKEMQAGWKDPSRFVLGHPFNPPHLVPLVEVVGSASTPVEILDWAVEFYRLVGKRPLKLKKEIEAYIANRLQHAIYLEALSLVEQGICDYSDIDDAVTWGPGLRWAVQGPVLHRHLGGGKGGVRHMIDHFGWNGIAGGEVEFIDAVERRWGHVSVAELESWRDDNLLAILEGLTPPPQQ